jgi:hypothetical protein
MAAGVHDPTGSFASCAPVQTWPVRQNWPRLTAPARAKRAQDFQIQSEDHNAQSGHGVRFVRIPGSPTIFGHAAPPVLEHFQTNLDHPDRVRKSAGQEWRAAGAVVAPASGETKPAGFLTRSPKGRADWGSGPRCSSLTMRRIARSSRLTLNSNRLRQGDPGWSESAMGSRSSPHGSTP